MKYLFCLLMALPMFSYAEDVSPNVGTEIPVAAPVEAPEIPQPGSQKFVVGLKTVDFNYNEPGLMSDRGWLSGLNFQYHRMMSETNTLIVSADYVQGSTVYNGALQTNTGNTTPYSSTEQFRVMSLEAAFSSPISNSGTWGVLVGLGYRNTYDNKTGQYDYRRDITYYYTVLGLTAQLYNQGKIKAVGIGELNTLLGGGAKTYLSDVSSSYKDVNFAFRNGAAVKIGVETTIKDFIGKEILVDVSYKYWTVADSNVEYVGNNSYGLEPHNTTGLTSISVGYVF